MFTELFQYDDGKIFLPKKRYSINEKPLCLVDGCNNVARNKGKDHGGYIPFCNLHYYGASSKKKGYIRYKKSYCENIDGRLGFMCEAVIMDMCMLTVDHIDENHVNNNLDNLQTLCANCHNYKTKMYRNVKSFDTMTSIMNENKSRFIEAYSIPFTLF